MREKAYGETTPLTKPSPTTSNETDVWKQPRRQRAMLDPLCIQTSNEISSI